MVGGSSPSCSGNPSPLRIGCFMALECRKFRRTALAVALAGAATYRQARRSEVDLGATTGDVAKSGGVAPLPPEHLSQDETDGEAWGDIGGDAQSPTHATPSTHLPYEHLGTLLAKTRRACDWIEVLVPVPLPDSATLKRWNRSGGTTTAVVDAPAQWWFQVASPHGACALPRASSDSALGDPPRIRFKPASHAPEQLLHGLVSIDEVHASVQHHTARYVPRGFPT